MQAIARKPHTGKPAVNKKIMANFRQIGRRKPILKKRGLRSGDLLAGDEIGKGFKPKRIVKSVGKTTMKIASNKMVQNAAIFAAGAGTGAGGVMIAQKLAQSSAAKKGMSTAVKTAGKAGKGAGGLVAVAAPIAASAAGVSPSTVDMIQQAAPVVMEQQQQAAPVVQQTAPAQSIPVSYMDQPTQAAPVIIQQPAPTQAAPVYSYPSNSAPASSIPAGLIRPVGFTPAGATNAGAVASDLMTQVKKYAPYAIGAAVLAAVIKKVIL
jgi:hypothetical protein